MRTKKKNVMRTPEEKEAIVLEYLNDKHPSYRKTADRLFEKKNLKSFEVLNIINSKGFICA